MKDMPVMLNERILFPAGMMLLSFVFCSAGVF